MQYMHAQLAGIQLKIITNLYGFRSVRGSVLNCRIPFSLCSLHFATNVWFNFRDCQLAGIGIFTMKHSVLVSQNHVITHCLRTCLVL